MFTWLQTHIQKHHKIVFGALLVLIIIAFVFTIGNFGGFAGAGAPQTPKREFYGFNLNSQRDLSALRNWTMITFALDGRRWDEDVLEIGVMQRAISHLASQLQIPGPTQEQFQDYLANRPAFQNPATGNFDQNRYTLFLDNFRNNPQMGEDTLITALSQNFQIEQIRRALGGPGYVLPYQAVQEIQRRETVWSIVVATLDRQSFDPQIAASNDDLAQYYAENKARFETDPELIAEYVMIDAETFIDQMPEPTPSQLTAHYNRNRAKWPKTEDGKTKPLDDIRDQVVRSFQNEEAVQKATDEANRLAVAIYDAAYEGQWAFGDGNVEQFLQRKGYELKPLPPLSKGNLPENAPLPPSALKQALSLNQARFYSDGLPTDQGAALIILQDITETTIPPLEDVRPTVLADYLNDEKARRFNLRAQELQEELQAAVEAGNDFAQTAETLGLKLKQYDDFTLIDRPPGLDQLVLSTMLDMRQGEVSNLVGFGDLGTIIYVAKKDVPEVDPESAEVQSQIERLAQYTAQATEAGIFNELIAQGEKSFEIQEP